jgi:hypothetical protein
VARVPTRVASCWINVRVCYTRLAVFFYFIFLRLLCPETEKTGRDNPRLSRMDLSFPATKNNKFTWVLIVIE